VPDPRAARLPNSLRIRRPVKQV